MNIELYQLVGVMNSLSEPKRKHNVPVPPFSVNKHFSPGPPVYRSLQVDSLKPVRSSMKQPIRTAMSPDIGVRQVASPSLNQDRSPRGGIPLPTTDEVRRLRAQLERFEKDLTQAKQRFDDESRAHAAEKARLRDECERLKRLHNKSRPQTKEIAVQTIPMPICVPTRRFQRPNRETRDLPSDDVFADPPKVGVLPTIPETSIQVAETSDDKENTSVRVLATPKKQIEDSAPVAHSPKPVSMNILLSSPRVKASPKAALRRALAGQSVAAALPRKTAPRTSIGPTATASATKEFVDQISEKHPQACESILEQFDKVDGPHKGSINRDACLVMISLLLESKGVRHCSIPKVICSRIMRSVNSAASPSGTASDLSLKRDLAIDFVKLVLEFILEQERPTGVNN